MSINCEASSYSTRNNYISLDPNYTDHLGRPLVCVTFDFPENDRIMARYCVDKAAGIAAAMGAKQVVKLVRDGHWDTVPCQSSYACGGFVMGSNPATSSVNKYLQAWAVPNLFVVGAYAFPQNAGYNPTGTVGALAYKAAHAIRPMYLKNPGRLISA
ncbi:GMC oxidoreductase [Pseudomonas helleri]|uniref:GMC oxidoreductase n=1 Tax=Pseudomonas helleri TaxID=1608996 RepID=UPI003342A3AA